MAFSCDIFKPTRWTGRYGKIPGNDSAMFHIRHCPAIRKPWLVVDWSFEGADGQCWAEKTTGVANLVEAVRKAKLAAGGRDGLGGFIIDEFDHVLVPASSGNGNVYLAGTVEGLPRVIDPFEDHSVIDLYDDDDYECGDVWDAPYVGTRFNLGRHNRIYYWQTDGRGGESIFPDYPDDELVQAIRQVRRGRRPVRFIVNPAGIVLTKRPPKGIQDDENEGASWESVYVGRIDYEKWFDTGPCTCH
jgi:hypothetical protein